MIRLSKPQRANNPFSLIQKKPDKWRGLLKSDTKGFLYFDSVSNGVRAGFINLYNRYLNRGLDTIEKIFPVYAPPFENDTEAYIRTVCKLTGFTPDQKLNPNDFEKLGRAIIQVEAGKFWVNEDDFQKGFLMANQKFIYG
jgi:hypothetical protein